MAVPPNTQRWALYSHHLGDYMRRWILRTPWGTLRLHHILRSDEDKHLHDHPFDFTSFLLSGGYVEVIKVGAVHCPQIWPRFSVVRKQAEDAHRLILDRPIWTIVISGPKRRSWGFHTENGWVNHREYLRLNPEAIIARVGPGGYADAIKNDAARSA